LKGVSQRFDTCPGPLKNRLNLGLLVIIEIETAKHHSRHMAAAGAETKSLFAAMGLYLADDKECAYRQNRDRRYCKYYLFHNRTPGKYNSVIGIFCRQPSKTNSRLTRLSGMCNSV